MKHHTLSAILLAALLPLAACNAQPAAQQNASGAAASAALKPLSAISSPKPTVTKVWKC